MNNYNSAKIARADAKETYDNAVNINKESAEKMAATIQKLEERVQAVNGETAQIISAAGRFRNEAEALKGQAARNNEMISEVEAMAEIYEFPQNEEEAEIGHAKVA